MWSVCLSVLTSRRLSSKKNTCQSYSSKDISHKQITVYSSFIACPQLFDDCYAFVSCKRRLNARSEADKARQESDLARLQQVKCTCKLYKSYIHLNSPYSTLFFKLISSQDLSANKGDRVVVDARAKEAGAIAQGAEDDEEEEEEEQEHVRGEIH